MNKQKRKIALLLICALLIGLCGCGKPAASDAQTEGTTQSSEQLPNGTTTESESDGTQGSEAGKEDTEADTQESAEDTETQTPDSQQPSTQKPENNQPQQGGGSGSTSNTPQTQDEKLAAKFWKSFGNYRGYIGEEKSQAACKASVELVKKIMSQYKTEFDREKAVHDYILQVCEYDQASLSTGLKRTGQTPYGVLIEGLAVCGGYANTFMICMNMMDIECNMIKDSEHGWNQVKIDGEWYEVDCTWDENTSSYRFFNLTSAQMDAADHAKYKVSRPRTCNGTKYGSEYMRQLALNEFKADYANYYFDSEDEIKAYLNQQAAKGIAESAFFIPSTMKSLIDDHSANAVWAVDGYKKDYYDYYILDYPVGYNGYQLNEVTQIEIVYRKITDAVGQDKYFTSLQELKNYIATSKANNVNKIKFYMNKALYEAQPNWAPYVEYSRGSLGNLHYFELWYYEGSDPWEYWIEQGWY